MRTRHVVAATVACLLAIALGAPDGIAVAGEKIPITTSSDEARELYLKGRVLADRVRFQEARPVFSEAVELDSGFALAYLSLATVQPSLQEYFQTFELALALKDRVSEGERLMILATQAANGGNLSGQQQHYEKLVALHPDDERAHGFLGDSHFAQQNYTAAIASYERATAINPNSSRPYNLLGYAHRFMGNYDQAEKAFQSYIKLIPGDPNPYDSYAELLLKMGRYDESIANYSKALVIDSGFQASYVGIAANLDYKGEHADARQLLERAYSRCLDDGQRRLVSFGMTVSYMLEGDYDGALAEMDRQYDLARASDNLPGMAADLGPIGDIHLDRGDTDAALTSYESAVKLMEQSEVDESVKANARRRLLFNTGRVLLKKADLAGAKKSAAAYAAEAAAVGNPVLIQQAHQLAGMIALAEKNYELALTELNQASLLDPYNLFRIALAHQGLGDTKNARVFCERAAHFNGLISLNYAFIRAKASRMLAEM